MTANKIHLQGNDWQDWANQLLTVHYGPTEYSRVPDKQKGDGGLEGFTLTDGHVYQAYGCEEPISLKDRFEKQRNKMTRDLKKFVENQALLEKLFGETKIKKWVLFVPVYDSKDLIAHAAKKTKEIKAFGLPYVDTQFNVTVCEEKDFATEKEQILNNKSDQLDFEIATAGDEAIAAFSSDNDHFIATIDKKIAKLSTLQTGEKRLGFRNSVLRWYLQGQELLDSLKVDSPSVFGTVLKIKSQRESYLVADSLAAKTSEEQFGLAINKLLDSLKSEAKQLSTSSAEALAHEAVADWLIRCPFDPIEQV